MNEETFLHVESILNDIKIDEAEMQEINRLMLKWWKENED